MHHPLQNSSTLLLQAGDLFCTQCFSGVVHAVQIIKQHRVVHHCVNVSGQDVDHPTRHVTGGQSLCQGRRQGRLLDGNHQVAFHGPFG